MRSNSVEPRDRKIEDPFSRFEKLENLPPPEDVKQKERAAFLENFTQKKEKNLLFRAFLRKHASQDHTLAEKKPADVGDLHTMAIRKHFNFETEVKKDIMKNPRFGTMQKLIANNMLEVADDKASSLKYGALYNTMNKHEGKRRFKLGVPKEEPISPSKNIKFDDIKDFYFVNIADIELMKVEDVVTYKKKEVKEQIIQLGKRVVEEERILGLLGHPRTTRFEKERLYTKLKAQRSIIQHGKERILALLKKAPFTIEEIQEELKVESFDDGLKGVFAEKADKAKVTQDNEISPGNVQGQSQEIHDELADPREYKARLEEKIKKARKFMNISYIDARALKNRLGASSISEFVDVFKDYKNTEKYDLLQAIVQESLCSKLRGEHFLDIVERIIEMEEKEFMEHQIKGVKGVEKKVMEERDPIKVEDRNMGDILKEEETKIPDADLLYFFLPLWYTDFAGSDNKALKLQEKFKMSTEVALQIQKTTRMKTLNDLIPFYRHNRGVKHYSIFTPEEYKVLLSKGWTKGEADFFIKNVVQLSKEALQVPKLLFNLARPDADVETLELEGLKGLPLSAVSALTACLISNNRKLKRLRLRNMGLSTEMTTVLQLLIASPENKLIELDFSKNPIKDEGVLNILRAFKNNPNDNIQVIKLEECFMASQGAVTFSSYLRETNFTSSLVPVQVLSLRGNHIGNVGLETLCFTLKNNTHLKYLDLSHNNISGGTGGMIALVDVIRSNKSLKTLYLHGNKFDTDSINKFLDELADLKECALCILKFGDMHTNVDNVCKFIRDGLSALANLRYCELVSKCVVTDQFGNIDKLVKNQRKNLILRVTAESIPENDKVLVDMLSDLIYDEIQYKEKLATSSPKQIKNEYILEYFERIIQQIASNVYKFHSMECIALLVESYLPYDADLRRGDTLIHRMAQFGQNEGVQYMLSMGADPDARTALTHPDFPYATVLHVAIAAGSLELTRYLLTCQAIIDAKDANENTPLHYAASLGKAELVDFLIGRGCSLELVNKKRMEPLHAAILSDDIKTLEYILKKINPYFKPEFTKEQFEKRIAKGFTSLMIAIEDGSIHIFHYIMRYGVRLNSVDDRGRTALHYAVELKRYEMIDTLLRQRPNLNIKDNLGEIPIFIAVRQSDLPLVQKLYDHQSRLDGANTRGDTLLHLAAKNNDIQMVSWLMDRGLDSTVTNIMNQLPKELSTNKAIKALLPDRAGFPQYDMYSEDGNLFTSPIINPRQVQNTNQKNNQYQPYGNEGGMNDLRDLQGGGEVGFDDGYEENLEGEEYRSENGTNQRSLYTPLNQTYQSQYDPQRAKELPSKLNATVNNTMKTRNDLKPQYPVRQGSRRSLTPMRAQQNQQNRPASMNRSYIQDNQDDYYQEDDEDMYNSNINSQMNNSINNRSMNESIQNSYDPRPSQLRGQGNLPPINSGGLYKGQKQGTSLNKLGGKNFDPNTSYYSYLETLTQQEEKGNGLPKRPSANQNQSSQYYY